MIIQNSVDLFTKDWLLLNPRAKRKSLSNLSSLETLFAIVVILEKEIENVVISEMNRLGLEPLLTDDPLIAIEWITKYGSRIILVISNVAPLTDQGLSLRQGVIQNTNDTPFVYLSANEIVKGEENLSIDQYANLPHLGLSVADFKNDIWFDFLKTDLLSRISFLAEEVKHRAPYIQNAQNLMQQTETLILSLEGSDDTQTILDTIFGNIHTLKGGSGFLQPKTLYHFLHRFEDYINKLKIQNIKISSNQVSLMLKALDKVKELLSDLTAEFHHLYKILEFEEFFEGIHTDLDLQDEVLDQKEQKADIHDSNLNLKTDEDKSLRVPIALLDSLMHISGELTVVRNMINKIDRNLKVKNADDKEYERMSGLLEELHRLNGGIQKHILDLRKVPIKEVVAPLNRIVRDVSKQLSKIVTLKIEGSSLRIDTFLAEVLNNSLVHLVRNSIDHGFETPKQRIAKGKKQSGILLIKVWQEKEFVYVDIVDDGRGMQTVLIRHRALDQGLITQAEAKDLADEKIWKLIFSSGFSTAEKVTGISGRGIGMSAVKESVESLGGDIIIESVADQGTTMKLVLPLPKSVLIARCIFVLISGLQLGVSSENIFRFIHLEKNDENVRILKMDDYFLLSLDKEIIPIADLRKILGVSTREEIKLKTIVVLQNSVGLKLGIIVDDLLEFENTVVKPFTDYLKAFDIFFGTTFLGDGSIGLIFNIDGLFNVLDRTLKPTSKFSKIAS